jgi:hypothetical protein
LEIGKCGLAYIPPHLLETMDELKILAGAQKKLIRHVSISTTTDIHGSAQMEVKRKVSSK